ncbi:MAG: response regulator, partial [bacterium]
ILDYNLSNGKETIMNGLDILKTLKKQKHQTKVIMLSGLDDDELVHEFINSGARKYIHKDNYFIDTLIQVINKEVQVN